jgi:putative transposase
MFNDVLVGRSESIPQSLSSDHDPLFLFHRWRANLRILQIREIKTVPYVPPSHPFVERLIGTIQREFLDQAPFWTSTDLERKLSDFMRYYNRERTHQALGGKAPAPSARAVADIRSVMWQSHCRGLYQLPFAAWLPIRTPQVADQVWLVSFMHYDLGFFDNECCRVEAAENPFGVKALPMPPE